MAAILLDTTVLIDILRGRTGAVDRLRSVRGRGDTPYVCAVNVEEMARGVRSGEDLAVTTLLRGLRVAPLGVREGWQAGTWRRAFAARGMSLSQADCLIAAAAAGLEARLATGNPKDFPMAEIAVEHWPVGA